MELYYHKAKNKNFGDDLNAWLWDKVLPGWQQMASPKHTLFGVGSILHHSQLALSENPIVFGSGYNQGPVPQPELFACTDFRAVRGPLTKQAIGLEHDIAMGDPAILIADVLPKAAQASGKALLIPHHHYSLPPHQELLDLDEVAREAGLQHLSPMGESVEVIQQISAASLVVTESLHGAILADAYRVPWICAKMGPQFTPYKWYDWTGSLGVSLEVHDLLPEINTVSRFYNAARWRLFPKTPNVFDWRAGYLPFSGKTKHLMINRLRQLASKRSQLSADTTLNTQKERLFASLDQVSRDYAAGA